MSLISKMDDVHLQIQGLGRDVKIMLSNYEARITELEAQLEITNQLNHYEHGLSTQYLKDIEIVKAQLADAKKANQWQPIEAAPKDGTPLLLFGAVLNPEVGLSYKPGGAVLAGWSTDHECWDITHTSYYSVIAENPTYWMPLPAAPAVQA